MPNRAVDAISTALLHSNRASFAISGPSVGPRSGLGRPDCPQRLGPPSSKRG